MRLSVFTTITNPIQREDNPEVALRCYGEMADELVVINGGNADDVDKLQNNWSTMLWEPWPKEFDWQFIGQQFQKGYEACTGDWVIHADIDMMFHEDNFQLLRDELQKYNDQPAVSFVKRQFILPDRFSLKSRLIVAVNKGKFADRIRFDSGGDLCQPSLDGAYIAPGTVPDVKVPIWNYECLLKTKEQLIEDKGRFARAWQRHYGEYKLGGPDDESAYNAWLKMVVGRFSKPSERVELYQHPKYIQQTISSLKPHMWGYDGLGNLERNDYA